MGSIRQTDTIAILSTIILAATIITIIFAFTAYMISVARRRRAVGTNGNDKKESIQENSSTESSSLEYRILKPYNYYEENDNKNNEGNELNENQG